MKGDLVSHLRTFTLVTLCCIQLIADAEEAFAAVKIHDAELLYLLENAPCETNVPE